MFKRILVPIDGSQHAEKALTLGADLAAKYGAELYLCHVLLSGKVPRHLLDLTDKEGREEPAIAVGAGYVDASLSRDVLEDIAQNLLAQAKQTAEQHGATQVQTTWQAGPGAEAILGVADDAGVDAIVMGSRGLSDFAGMVVGSTSHKVAHRFDGTVITVK